MDAEHLTVIQINGSINSGKSTIGRALANILPDANFIDGDDHGIPEDVPATTRWTKALTRIERHIKDAKSSYLVVAYPIDHAGFEQLRSACERRVAGFFVVTLSLPLEMALTDRGDRRLTNAERQRIAEMYREGYQSREFSDLFLDTSLSSPKESAEYIAAQIFNLQ